MKIDGQFIFKKVLSPENDPLLLNVKKMHKKGQETFSKNSMFQKVLYWLVQ